MEAFEQHTLVVNAAREIVERIHGIENYHLNSQPTRSASTFIIKFPKLTIKNKQGLSHNIVDLYVSFSIEGTHLHSSFKGTRGKLTQLEAISKYSHSHLPEGAMNTFASFCRGDGSFQMAQSNLQLHSWLDSQDQLKEDTLLTFEGWLFEMIGFLEWESLESRPHKWIDKLGRGDSQQPVTSEDQTISYARFLKNADFSKIRLLFKEDKYVIAKNNALEKEMLKAVTKFQYVAEDGTFFSSSNLYPVGIREDFASFKFKDQQIKQEVTKSAVHTDMSQQPLYAHRSLYKYIYDQLQSELHKQQLEWSRKRQAQDIIRRTARVRETYSAGQMLPENLIPVSENQ